MCVGHFPNADCLLLTLVQVILAVQGIKTLTDPNTLPTIIADAITLVKDPKAAIENIPGDLLDAVKTILSIPEDAGQDLIGPLEAFLGKLDFPGKLFPSAQGKIDRSNTENLSAMG